MVVVLTATRKASNGIVAGHDLHMEPATHDVRSMTLIISPT
jgi:hypothetical protein